MADDRQDANDAVVRLKQAGRALDAATKASKQTVKEVARAKRAVAEANKKLAILNTPRKRQSRKRRRKPST